MRTGYLRYAVCSSAAVVSAPPLQRPPQAEARSGASVAANFLTRHGGVQRTVHHSNAVGMGAKGGPLRESFTLWEGAWAVLTGKTG